MKAVLQMRRDLLARPRAPDVTGVLLRGYRGSEDIEPWLRLREEAFADQPRAVRPWSVGDFHDQFLAKAWWRPQWMWLAQRAGEDGALVGSVTLAMRAGGATARPAVHWLAVLPRWRRHGVGRLLMAALEAACWDLGRRQVWLETHAEWSAAIRFYQAMGYREDGVLEVKRRGNDRWKMTGRK